MMTIDEIELDHDLQWEDEFKTTLGVGKAERSLSGTLIVQSFINHGGRPITLVGNEGTGWLSRTTVEALFAKAAVANNIMTLTIGETTPRTFLVQFRHEEPPVLDFTPITLVPDEPTGDFWYYGTVKLRQIG